ncbi:YheT family hydrolase [Ideonella livida]|uniref:Alpha/beta fold hydrolase n=1 Tax=Ideonella livida TaxID=2707176 RepID=A0A7C9TLY5_9BURK|nr:alpha/beta fold hydrolase [Ideonella livida]NDY93859.1 alpha/beta fold hydrolase [Ideonella livida]
MATAPPTAGTWRYRAPAWLPGGHAQTIWAALYARRTRGQALTFERERWTTPDGDFIDVDLRPHPLPGAPWLVLFHGLEGSSASSYAQAFGELAQERGLSYAVPHFRGCSGELNHGPRAYHSGDHEEIGWILARLRAQAPGPLQVVGISLGGNALLRWAQEQGAAAAATASAVAAVCSPIDLAGGGASIDAGFNRRVYARMFLQTMKPKALAKLAQHPGLFDRQRLLAARTLYEFDQVFTAPLHGFASTEDYWRRASAKPHLAALRLPALVLNARNDPFLPARHLPHAGEVGRWVRLWQPREGGHVGFPAGVFPGHVQAMPEAVLDWLQFPDVQG